LSAAFVDDWRMPLSAEARQAVAAVDWQRPDLTPAQISEQVKAASTDLFRKD
jgi:hypothetical protein